MKALTMAMPLKLSLLTVNAGRHDGDQGITPRLAEGGVHRRTCANAHKRVRRLAGALAASGAKLDNETTLEQHAWI
jgi:hypothetical protein